MARSMTIGTDDESVEEFPDSGNTPSEVEPQYQDVDGDESPDEPPSNIEASLDEIVAMSDPAALRDFLASSMAQESKSLRKLMTFVGRIEPKLRALQDEYTLHRERTSRLYSLATRGLVKS